MQQNRLTFDEAKRSVQSMNLIDGFLFTNVTENEEDAKLVIGTILSRVLGRKVDNIIVETEKVFNGIDTKHHGIRLDAHIKQDVGSEGLSATICDLEIENREADRQSLPKRHRYYSALTDSKLLPTSVDYLDLPEYISITISSYDPFLLGKMYYEAKTCIIDHPEYNYDDGITHIFLYAAGKINTHNMQYGKKLHEMLEYMVSGKKPTDPDNDINNLDKLVTGVKSKSEVTKSYMRQWEREIALQREAAAEARAEAMAEAQNSAAIDLIQFAHENNINDEIIRQKLHDKYSYSDSEIDGLFNEALHSIV